MKYVNKKHGVRVSKALTETPLRRWNPEAGTCHGGVEYRPYGWHSPLHSHRLENDRPESCAKDQA